MGSVAIDRASFGRRTYSLLLAGHLDGVDAIVLLAAEEVEQHDLTFGWFATRTHFRVRSKVYDRSPGKGGALPHLAGGI